MQNSMFSGLFGALTNEHRMNSIANNLANVNTVGYKRDTLAFKDTFMMYAHDQIMEPIANVRSEKLFPDPHHAARPRLAVSQTDFSQGSLKGTGGTLDLAISGEGFFTVMTPQGEYYTRNGHFRLDAAGTLITEQGYPVMSNGGEIVVPPGVKSLVVAEDGQVYGDDEVLGQINVVNIDNPSASLEKLGHNLFRGREGAEVALIEENVGTVAQGFLEMPNVDVVYEMVNMIEAQRQFEAYQKVMQTSDAVDREATTKVGRNR
ncbi:MAG: flagellar basal-body rod protein FlgF [Deltaproteobacteria bacterium]|jgi:flagellar basal-body rod protein FlgG|nr:flagellar basal-body rod protein FlgF [Deltaproteobacteria bacterium]